MNGEEMVDMCHLGVREDDVFKEDRTVELFGERVSLGLLCIYGRWIRDSMSDRANCVYEMLSRYKGASGLVEIGIRHYRELGYVGSLVDILTYKYGSEWADEHLGAVRLDPVGSLSSHSPLVREYARSLI